MEKVILLLCLVGLVFGAYIVDQPNATRGKDNWMINHEGDRTTNQGSSTIIAIGSTASGVPLYTGLIEFDTLNSIPLGSIVDSAKITFYIYAAGGTEIYYCARGKRIWGELTSTFNTYDGVNNWTVGGAQGEGTDRYAPTDSFALTGSGYKTLDVTPTVQADVTAGTHRGWVWYIVNAGPYQFARSSDYGTALKRPKLEVWYPDVPATGAKAIYYSTPFGIRRGR